MNEIFNQLGHKFAIGDIVTMRGSATETASQGSWGSTEDVRGLIVERVAQQCHTGVQLHYQVRWVAASGNHNPKLEMCVEIELEASVPFETRPAKKAAD